MKMNKMEIEWKQKQNEQNKIKKIKAKITKENKQNVTLKKRNRVSVLGHCISLSKVLPCESYSIRISCRIICFKWKQEAYPVWIS